jgi:hypothetical protein
MENDDDLPERTLPEVMLDWTADPNPQRQEIAREYWDSFESGVPMGDDDR